MKAVLFTPRDGSVRVDDIPPPVSEPGFVLARTAYSLISAGTERARLEAGKQGLIGKARARPDQAKQVVAMSRQIGLRETYRAVQDRLSSPGLVGYSSSGIVIDAPGMSETYPPGTPVALAGGGYANHAEIVRVPKNLCAPLPGRVSLKHAAFATVGSIALHGIHQAGVEPGSRVAVIGLGLVGQLACRLLTAYGYDTVGIDVDPRMIQLAEAASVKAIHRDQLSLIESMWASRGADAVLIAAAARTRDPIETAGRIGRDRCTVVVVGDVDVSPPRASYYGKEMTIRYSRSYGPGRYDPSFEEGGLEYPEGFVPWTEKRNLEEFLRLCADDRLRLDSLDPALFPIDQADSAYAALDDSGDQRQVAILLEYPERDIATPTLELRRTAAVAREKSTSSIVSFASIGAGSFPTRMLFPHLSRLDEARFTWLSTSSGASAKHQGERWGFTKAVSDPVATLKDREADCVLVLSGHDTHTRFTIEALNHDHAVFCEKPLGLTEEDLDQVAEAWLISGQNAMAGFNRRFAPSIRDLRAAVRSAGPLQVNYRIFAGALPKEHWYFNPQQGGRVLGEVCHFIDTVGWIVGLPPTQVYARSAHPPMSDSLTQSVTLLLTYADGSVGSILYGGSTPPRAPKEFVEVAGNGIAARLEDFSTLTLWQGRKRVNKRYRGSDKGHKAEMESLVRLIRGSADEETDFRLSLWSSLATCRAVRSMAQGAPVEVVPETSGLRKALLEGTD